MPYALIPDGYSLEKVTKAQEQALKDKRRHDDVVTVLNNPEIIKQIIITGVAFLAAREAKEVLGDLKDLGVDITEDVEDAYTKKRTFGTGLPVGVSIEDLIRMTPGEIAKRIPFL
tara:strand:+ start:55 stop:399 length:345 start_codon:yes stop_codon:yes gene_type:complete